MSLAHTDTRKPEDPKLIHLGDAAVVRQAVDNMGWISLGDGTLVVDALEQPELEQEVFQAIADTTSNNAVQYVLNTHCHYDHVALNEAFRQKHSAEIVNQRTSHIPPEGTWFEGPQRRVQMVPAADCHTPEDCLIWSPADSVLFVGDIFGWGLIPWDGNLKPEKQQHLIEVYRRLISYEARHVVPGHGPLCATAELKRWLEYFQWLLSTVRELFAKGRSRAEIVEAVPPPEDMLDWWRFQAWKHEDSLKKVMKAAEKKWL